VLVQCRFLVCVILILAAPVVSGKSLEDRQWIEVQTANFKVRSLLDRKKTIELARYLELFRAAVTVLTNASDTDSPIPTEIFAVKGPGDFAKFGLGKNLAGIFMPNLRRNTILIRNTLGMTETGIILHEYTHFMLRNHSKHHYPQWYDEGFAEYLSGTRIKNGYFEIGLVPSGRRNSFIYSRWIPMKRILTAEDYDDWRDEDKAMFYAEAWALVHYLFNRSDTNSSFAPRLAHFLELLESGEEEIAAFETAFGIDANVLNRNVKKYLKSRLMGFRINIEKLLPEFTPGIRRLSREEVCLALGQLALQRAKTDLAEHWFTVALSDKTTQPEAEAGLGDILKFDEKFDLALPHFEKAAALAPQNPYIQIDAGEYWSDRAQSAPEQGINTEDLDRARAHYVAAWKLDDSIPEIYAMYGLTYLTEGENYPKAVEMLEAANDRLPSNLDIRLMLAQAYAGAKRNEQALKEARFVLTWSHEDSEAAKQARELLSQLDAEP